MAAHPPFSAARRLLRPVVESAAPPQAWLLAGLVVASILLFRDTWANAASIWWRSETFAHGMLVPPLVAWLIWRKRREINSYEWHTWPVGLLLVVGVTALWVAGRVAQVQVAEQFAAAAMIPALVLCVAGLNVSRAIAFPLGFLLLAAPFGEALIEPLMEFTASFSVAALRASGFAVYREGLFFSTTVGDFEVAKACSGIRYLIASLTVGMLGAYLMFSSWRRRAIFIGLSILVPIVGNGIRVYLTVILAHVTSIETAAGMDHVIYGWLFFGVLIAALVGFGSRFADRVEVPFAGAAAPRRSLSRADALVAAAAAAAMAVGPAWAGLALRASSDPAYSPALFTASGVWSGPQVTSAPWRHGLLPEVETRTGEYVDAQGRRVIVSLFWLPGAAESAELVSSTVKLIAAGPAIKVADLGVASAGLSDLRLVSVATETESWRIAYGYAVNGRLTASVPVLKLLEGWMRVRGHRADRVIVAFSTPAVVAGGNAQATLVDFVSANRDALERALATQ